MDQIIFQIMNFLFRKREESRQRDRGIEHDLPPRDMDNWWLDAIDIDPWGEEDEWETNGWHDEYDYDYNIEKEDL